MPSLGAPELIIILVVVVIIFGVGRLPEVGGALGKGIREFRKSTKDDDEKPGDNVAMSSPQPEGGAAAAGDVVFCTECGKGNQSGVKFCGHCGAAIGTAVS